MDYDFELEKAANEIKRLKAETVCIQLADGLKPEATRIVDYLEEKTGAKIFVWADTCFGACDFPQLKNVDLLIQFGHAKWKKPYS
ncbi:diphthamide synthesis protein [Candidatus Woesearchaeota archaeon]|nr:diphthamide synthesis protein [Candidatus Woesearchaeota archaeon]